MFKILKRNEIDTQKWDKCVNQNSSIPTIYANSWYLDIVSPNWKAAIWGDYETVFPLTIKYKYFFLPLLLQPVFSQQLGFFGDILTEKETFIFLNFLKRKFIHINIQLNTNHNSTEITLKRPNLCLIFSNDINKSYSTNTKSNIKKAIKNELVVKETGDYEKLITFFYNEKNDEFKLNTKNIAILKTLAKKFKEIGILHLFSCTNTDNDIVASGIFVKSTNRITFFNGTANENGRKIGAMAFLMNHAIYNLCNEGDIFDFEGSEKESLARFYAGFAATNNAYDHYKYTIFKNMLISDI